MSTVLVSLNKNTQEESDSDEEVNTARDAVVVFGEAPESDEDEEEDEDDYAGTPLEDSGDKDSPPTPTPEVGRSKSSRNNREQVDQQKLKYDTLLHKKLRERNEHLKQELVNIACSPYNNATKEISVITQQLVRSQKVVQGVSTSLRKISRELTLIKSALDSARLQLAETG